VFRQVKMFDVFHQVKMCDVFHQVKKCVKCSVKLRCEMCSVKICDVVCQVKMCDMFSQEIKNSGVQSNYTQGITSQPYTEIITDQNQIRRYHRKQGTYHHHNLVSTNTSSS
jgi:hypothetical protein